MSIAFNLSQFANNVNNTGQANLTTAVTGVLPVANGGTGLSSPGASGNVLQSNGTGFVSTNVAFWPGMRGQAFTSSGTFTIPSGITALKVTVVGGGGGSGAGVKNINGWTGGYSGGGGAGGVAIKYLTGLTPGNTLSITVGLGGTPGMGSANPTAGGIGGTSTIASGTQTITTVYAYGGLGSNVVLNDSGLGDVRGAAGGATLNADIGANGAPGTNGSFIDGYLTNGYGGGGTGGNSPFGGGGLPDYNGTGYGSGAGGRSYYDTSNAYGGKTGANGIVLIEW